MRAANTPTIILALTFALTWGAAAAGVQAPPVQTAPKEAMARLSGWVGVWKGKGVSVGPQGQRSETDVTETIVSKAGGTILAVEGVGKVKDAQGRETVVHEAFGVIWYDVAARQYRFRTFVMQGYTVETEMKPLEKGYEWVLRPSDKGPAMRYTLNHEGDVWHEVGERSTDGKTWQRVFGMRLIRQR